MCAQKFTPKPPFTAAQVVRDLRWIIVSPSLFTSSDLVPCVSSEEFRAWFHADSALLDNCDPQALLEFVNTARRFKLGLYAEDLILYYLRLSPHFEVLAHDLQIFENKESVGAVDFIVRTASGTVEHWEMAVKYFMQHVPSPEWSDFVGPSGHDTLQRKMNKMLNRQLKLCFRESARQQLQAKGIPIPSRYRVLSLGRLFQRWNTPFVPPYSGAVEQPTGTWIKHDDFLRLIKTKNVQWRVRVHPDWLAPFVTKDGRDLLPTPEIGTLLDKTLLLTTDFVMLAEMRRHEDEWHEVHRWIVVSNDWSVEQ